VREIKPDALITASRVEADMHGGEMRGAGRHSNVLMLRAPPCHLVRCPNVSGNPKDTLAPFLKAGKVTSTR